MDIGVVVPTLNSGRTLSTTLASLLEQQDCAVDIIVADSGSTDSTLDICSRLGISTVYVPPGNMYKAINEGLRRLKNSWLAYLNSDDFIYADTYTRLLRLAEEDGADVVYGHGDFVDAAGRFLYSLQAPTPDRLMALFRARLFGFLPHGAVFRREVFEYLGGFSESLRNVADMDFFARACFLKRRFARESGPAVAVFRLHPGQLSHRERDIVKEEIATLVGEQWGRRRALESLLAIARWKLPNIWEYVIRWLRTGSILRRYLLESRSQWRRSQTQAQQVRHQRNKTGAR